MFPVTGVMERRGPEARVERIGQEARGERIGYEARGREGESRGGSELRRAEDQTTVIESGRPGDIFKEKREVGDASETESLVLYIAGPSSPPTAVVQPEKGQHRGAHFISAALAARARKGSTLVENGRRGESIGRAE
jgi:hypothetical protein